MYEKGIYYQPENKYVGQENEDRERQILLELLDRQNDSEHFLNNDDLRPMTSRRAERISLIIRSEILLSDMYRNIIIIKSYQITQECLMKFHSFSIGRK